VPDHAVSSQERPVALAVSASYTHSCALLSDHTVTCWGLNDSGQLGNGSRMTSSTPVAVSGLHDVVSISAQNGFTCALLSAGTVKCWGQIWDASASQTPVTVPNVTDAIDLGGGDDHMCALLRGGGVSCWGFFNGAYGWQTVTSAVALSRGEGSVDCAVLVTGEVACWGNNYCGEIGDRTVNDPLRNLPNATIVQGLSNAQDVAVGSYFTCALLTTGVVDCWGSTFGRAVGACTCFVGPCSEAPFALTSGAMAVAAGAYRACAVLDSGTIQCWGDNSHGGLGDGTTVDSGTPVSVSNIANATGVAVGGYHTCALLSDRTVECWGANYYGQLGNGTTQDSALPVRVSM